MASEGLSPVGYKVRRLRKQRGLGQEELARKAGCSVRTIKRIEAGERVDRGSAEKVALAFGFDDLKPLHEPEIVYSPFEVIDQAATLIDAGRPSDAERLLDKLPNPVLIDECDERFVPMLAKIYRRRGKWEEVENLKAIVWKRDHSELLRYERALAINTHAVMIETSPSWWNNAILAFTEIAPTLKGLRADSKRLKDVLIRFGAIVNAKAVGWLHLPNDVLSPTENESEQLRLLIDLWRSSSYWKEHDPQHHGRRLNALRALCRSYVVRPDPRKARDVYKEIVDLELERSILPQVDHRVLGAWCDHGDGELDRAQETIERELQTLAAVNDPLLAGIAVMLDRRVEQKRTTRRRRR